MEKEIASDEIGYQISDEGNKIPLRYIVFTVIRNHQFKFGKIILKLIMIKILQQFVN